MFYNKVIKIYQYEIIDNPYGEQIKGDKTFIKEFRGDLQPYSKERLYKAYGLDYDVTNVLYCDVIEDLNEKLIILDIEGREFEIKSLIQWDTHYEVMLWGQV